MFVKAISKMDEKCSICANYYEVCPNCKKEWVKLKGCVEGKKSGWHDNGVMFQIQMRKNRVQAVG
jgi:hypothetical protein